MEYIIDPKTHKPIKIGEGIISAINNMPKVYLHYITLKQIEEILKSHKTKQ